MKLIVINKSTSDAITYLSGQVLVPANSRAEVPRILVKDLVVDSEFIKDIAFNNIFLSDGEIEYSTVNSSRAYLNHVTSPSCQVVGDDWAYYLKVDSNGRGLVRSNIQVGLSDVSRTNRVPTTDLLTSSFITAEKTSTSTRDILRVGVSNLSGRKVLEVVNTSNIVIYVGSSTVTTSGSTRGRPINPKGSYVVAVDANVDLYIVSASSATYVVVEGA